MTVTGSPARSAVRLLSGTAKSTLITLLSSRVVITVPGLMRLPTLTRRKPTRPLKGARMTVSSSRARAASTRAVLAFFAATI